MDSGVSWNLSRLTMENMEWNTPAGMPTSVFTVTRNRTPGIRSRDKMAPKLNKQKRTPSY